MQVQGSALVGDQGAKPPEAPGPKGKSKLNMRSPETVLSVMYYAKVKLDAQIYFKSDLLCEVLVRCACNISIRSTCIYLPSSRIFVAYMHQLLQFMVKFESDSCQFLLNVLP